MKLLLDENLPTKLSNYFSDNHHLSTVSAEKWRGKKNGELLKLMFKQDFEGLVTLDKNLQYQQNLNKVGINIYVLNAPDSKLKTLKPFIEELELALTTLKSRKCY